MSLADTLKTRTAEMHRFAETRPLQKALVSGRADAVLLGTYLAQLGHLHRSLEEAIAHDALAKFHVLTSEHSRHIGNDLVALALQPDVLEVTRQQSGQLLARSSDDPWFALGGLYVLEGSMNGNRFIMRALAASLDLPPGAPGLSYWDPYGPAQRDRWLAFRSQLDQLQLDENQRHSVLMGADFMFEAIARISDATAGHLPDAILA